MDMKVLDLCILLYSFLGLSKAASSFTASREQDAKFGRITQMDDIIKEHIAEIHKLDDSEPIDVEHIIEEAQQVLDTSEFDEREKESAHYYLYVLNRISEDNTIKAIQHEMDRIITIMSTAEGEELHYALVRKNILGAFTDAAADNVMELLRSSFGKGVVHKFKDILKDVDVIHGKPSDAIHQDPDEDQEEEEVEEDQEDGDPPPSHEDL